ncbi:hypothetical protein BDZ89DRAFT_1139881 [Hymenopellis radicata]|nr:hypothetical protein BDZ89DRAFT_1139881 [Hymenopellis radicata]
MSAMFPSESSSPTPWASPSEARGLIIAFDVVAVVSSLSMWLFLITTRINRRIHRTRAWYTMFFTLAIFPLLYLTNVMFQFRSVDPPWGLCLFQAALIYAGPPSASAAVLGYMLDVALGLHAASSIKGKKSRTWDLLMPWLPLIVFSVMFCASIMAVTNTKTVKLDYTLATPGTQLYEFSARMSASITLLALAGMIGCEMWIVFMLVKNRRKFETRKQDLQISMAIRFGYSPSWLDVPQSAFITTMSKAAGAVWNISLVTVPFLAGLAFGTHRDLLRAWTSCFSSRPTSSPPEYVDLQSDIQDSEK